MLSLQNTFTSTGSKLLRHGDLLTKWSQGIPTPLFVEVALTEACTLNCQFCSVKNREKKYIWDYDRLISATNSFIKLGIKAITISGGGDPLCYSHVNDYLKFLLANHLQVGLITNGIGLNTVLDPVYLNQLSWLRISSNVFDYKDSISIPEDREAFKGTLGFSYVWTEGISTYNKLLEIKQIALKNKVEYVRLIPNCISTSQEQIKNNKFIVSLANGLGHPFFAQPKVFSISDQCLWGYVKPFLYCDEYLYPCSSTVLNPDADKKFNTSYRWCHYTEIEKVWSEPIKTIIDTSRCTHCVFCEQNKIMQYALLPQTHEDFI